MGRARGDRSTSCAPFCLSLPGTHEKETWGDAEHAGDVTFRVKDKIYVITGQDGGGASIRTTIEQQAELIGAFPDACRVAPYVGRFGWVNVDFDGHRRPEIAARRSSQAAWRADGARRRARRDLDGAR